MCTSASLFHIPYSYSAMPPRCQKCNGPVGNDEICTKCGMVQDMADADGGGARLRSKSPLVDSAERTTKVARMDISTPGHVSGENGGSSTKLPDIPFFPKPIPGKGRERDLTHGMRGKGKTHGG